jgi:hypothetical protein
MMCLHTIYPNHEILRNDLVIPEIISEAKDHIFSYVTSISLALALLFLLICFHSSLYMACTEFFILAQLKFEISVESIMMTVLTVTTYCAMLVAY